VNHKYLAERCGTSLAMLERHSGRFMPGNEDAQLALFTEAAAPTEQPENRVNPRPREAKSQLEEKSPGEWSVPKYRQFEHPNEREFELSAVAWVREMDGLRRALAA
jgi:hypothetical protein